MLFLPELTLLGSGLILFFMGLGKPADTLLRRTALILGFIVLAASFLSFRQEGTLFFASYKVDIFSQFFKLLMAAATIAMLLFTKTLSGIKEDSKAEYYLFIFMSLLGLMMLVSSVELIAIFVALELSSFAVYVMVPMRSLPGENTHQAEAGIKYLLFGVMATGFLLFGMSYLFGLTGSTYLSGIIEKLRYMFNQPAAVVAMIMVMAGLFYKMAIFPFHFWVPDIYEGSSNETTAFIATIPKLAAVAVLIRLVSMVHLDGEIMINILLVCTLASMFYGNLAALVQKDLKRMLGFSGIAHAGFILFGLLTFDTTGYTNAMYYITGYVVMNLACFLVICTISEDGRNLKIEELKGLNQRSPLLAFTLLVSLFSLAGIPPFVGFTGKFMLLIGALKHDSQLLIPVILAAINTAIAIYYYLSVVRVAYCSDEGNSDPLAPALSIKALAVVLILIIVYMGLTPSPFLDLATETIKAIM